MERGEKMKVLVAEKLAPQGLEKLRSHFEVDAYDRIDRTELLERIGEYDALIVRSGTKVNDEVISRARKLKMIGRAGIGVDNIDVEAATKKGILVANAPESNIVSAAEHTMAVMLALARNIPAANVSLAKGEWERSKYEGVELNGKTLGIIGLGRIGTLVAERALVFGMRVIAYDPFVATAKAKRLGVESKPTLDELLSESDFITLHVPKSEETYHMIGKEQFEKMKKGVRIINVSRGGVIDEEALIWAIENGIVAGAGLDVFECEPPGGSPLCQMPQVVATPHLGASTKEAQYKAGIAIAEQVIAGLKGEFVSGAVNITMPHREVVETLQPFLPLVEKLGKLLNRLVEGAVDEIELEFMGEISKSDTSLLTVAFVKGFLEAISTEPVTYVNARVIADERGINIKESKSKQSKDFLNLIRATAADESKKVSAAATLLGKNQELFVDVLEYEIEISPSKYMCFVVYEDRPGMIGKVGTLLGENDINIESLQVGRAKIEGNAAMGLSLDKPIPSELVSTLVGEEGIKDVKMIIL